jgi:hypothetical protein
MAVKSISAYDEFVDFITSLPTLEAIIDYNISPTAQARVSELLAASRNRRLTDAESAELDEYERLEHTIRKAKIRAFERLEEQRPKE